MGNAAETTARPAPRRDENGNSGGASPNCWSCAAGGCSTGTTESSCRPGDGTLCVRVRTNFCPVWDKNWYAREHGCLPILVRVSSEAAHRSHETRHCNGQLLRFETFRTNSVCQYFVPYEPKYCQTTRLPTSPICLRTRLTI